MSSANFDQFSGRYQELLDRSIRLSGEASQYFIEHKASYVARLVGKDFHGKILDYGCGVGLLSSSLKKHLRRAVIHGYDLSLESLKMIPPDLLAQGSFSNNIANLGYDYELAIISNVMHHIPPRDREQTIVSLAERISSGGHLVLFEHNPWNPLTQWVVKHCPFDDDAVLLTWREARGYLSTAQLAVVRRDFVIFFPRVLSLLRPLEPLLAWLPAGGQYVLVGAKA